MDAYAKYSLSDETITNLVVQHEAQMERLLSGRYFVATAQTLGLNSETPGQSLTPGGGKKNTSA